jgi:hypothetical protein
MLSVGDGTTLRFRGDFVHVLPSIGKGCDFSPKSLPRAGFRPKTGMLCQLTGPPAGTHLMSNFQVIEFISWQKH